MIVVCVASGPSLTAVDVEYCRGKATVIVVNDGYRIAPWADELYAADHRWWVSTPAGFDRSNVELSAGMKERWTCDPGTAKIFGLRYVPHEPGPGLGRDRVRGTNSGQEAIGRAVLRGATQILLLGYDQGATGNTHWFGDHPAGLNTPDGWLEDSAREFEAIAADLHARGVQAINCTRTTALRCFPRAAIQEVL